ncbi:MAG: hypothetical protein V3V00_03590 [Saprospiraceae bacterium]
MTEDLFYKVIIGWIIIAIVVFPFALKIAAPYGRHIRKGWGTLIDNRLGWMIYEAPALVFISGFFFLGDAYKSNAVWIMFSLFMLHYFNRTFIFPFRIQTKGKKVPMGIVVSAFLFNVVNGSIIGYFLGFIQTYSDDWINDPRFIVGLLVFTVGMRINWQSDNILINLRQPGETGYKIPFGGYFEKVSCPNHMGEIIEWSGYAIMMWALPGLSFAIWTMANLIPRALDHHRWYQNTFEDYPKDRKAIIPALL